MRNKYRMFRRGIVYWIQDNDTGKQETLGTKDLQEAKRLFAAKNEAHRQPIRLRVPTLLEACEGEGAELGGIREEREMNLTKKGARYRC